MKNVSKFLLIAAVSAPVLVSCMEETIPTNLATETQVQSSDKATSAMLWAMPARVNQYQTISDAAYDWGYGSMMHIRDVMTEEYAVVSSSYDWYTTWSQNRSADEGKLSTQTIWNFYWQVVQTTNNLVGTIKKMEAPTSGQLGMLGAAYAFRAMLYLDMARMYEYLPAVGTVGLRDSALVWIKDPVTGVLDSIRQDVDVTGYTVPIVDENITEESSRYNPRVSHDEMSDFILADLDSAEKYIDKLTYTQKTLPHLAAVYGLKARLYMWNEDYANAEKYARYAIDAETHTPLTRNEWLSTTSGFNTLSASSWIWGSEMIKEDDVVQSGILNWTSWASNETTYGYASAGPISMISAAIYDKINDNDFRKLSFKAPAGTTLAGTEPTLLTRDKFEKLPNYTALKFRPAQGNIGESSIGSASAYPLMRVEEMYFIEAEAAAHQDMDRGVKLFEAFMKQYRYAQFKCEAEDVEGLIDEIFFQKRIEFWGEGINYFDYKRLDKGVRRYYNGTNFSANTAFNVKTRPAWMNIVIVQTEANNNRAFVGWNNPDPSGCYKAGTDY